MYFESKLKKSIKRVETVEEFLARGGKITTLPAKFGVKQKISRLNKLKKQLEAADRTDDAVKVAAEIERCKAAMKAQ